VTQAHPTDPLVFYDFTLVKRRLILAIFIKLTARHIIIPKYVSILVAWLMTFL
jgi:hypothetical protein